MKSLKIGTITLSITLISLGVLIILGNIFKFNLLDYFMTIFSVILITLGLEIIIINSVSKRKNNDVNTKIDGKSIFIIILIIIVTFSFLSVNYLIKSFRNIDLNNINISELIKNDFNFFEYSYIKDYEVDVTDKTDTLSVNNPYGSVLIDSTDDNRIKVKAEIFIRSGEKEEADRLSDEIVSIESKNEQIRITSRQHDNKKSKVIYTVFIPSNLKLDIDNGFGEVTVNRIKNDINIRNKHGRVNVDDIYGDVKIKNKHGDITVYNVQKNSQIDSQYCDLEIKNIFGQLEVLNEHGDINIKSINDNVKVENKYGHITLNDIDANVDLVNIHDNIKVNNISGAAKINLEYGNIDLSNIRKKIDIFSKHSDITIDNEQFEQDVIVDNEFGNIQINTYETYDKYDWKLRTKYGDIESQFNEETDTTEQIVNIDNGSGILINVNNSNGDIEVE